MGNSWIRPHEWNKDRSKLGILSCELDAEGGEYELEVAPVLEVPRAEERGPKLSFCEHPFRDRLCNRTLSGPGQPIQPVDRRLAKVPCPQLNRIQDNSASTLETSITVTVSILGPLCTEEVVQDSCIGYQRFVSDAIHRERKDLLTWVLLRGYFIFSRKTGNTHY